MRTASGQYRLDPDSATFFGCQNVRLIARGSLMIGRFGRNGVISGSLAGLHANTVWHDAARKGWMNLSFHADLNIGDFEYGLQGEPAIRKGNLRRVSRATRSARVPKNLLETDSNA